MKNIVDFGYIIILKKEDLIKRVRSVRPNEAEVLAQQFSDIDTLRYEFRKNHFGQIDITEHSFNEKGELIDICGDSLNKPQKLNNISVFHLLSLDLAKLIKSENNFQPNDINTKVKLSEKIEISDGDLFYVPLKDFCNFADKNKNTSDIYRNLLKKVVDSGLKTALLSFNYEDDRRDLSYPKKRSYQYDSKINPYTDMVVDLYIGDEKLSFFVEFPSYNDDLEKIKKSFKADEANYKLMVEDFKNNEDETFVKSEGFIERLKFQEDCSEMFQRINGNILQFFYEDPAFLKKMKFIGNYRNEERMFLNSYSLIKICETLPELLLKDKKEKKPGMKF